MAPVDPDIARLVREERLVEAAMLASAIGEAHLASKLYERACDWKEATREALRAGEAVRALELAVVSGDDALTERAAQLVSVSGATAAHVAARLAARGHHAWAARVLDGAGQSAEAACEWERAGEATRAAAAFDQAGQPARATLVLERALRRDPGLADVSTMLGALLVRYGKWDAALRVLQRVPTGSTQRREALVSLVQALDGLQLSHASREAEAELASLGGPSTPGACDGLPTVATQARLFGRYDVLREVASSASARVLECVDLLHGDRVAIKLLASWDGRGAGRDALARFEREIRAMRALDHPRVVPLRDFSREPPALVLAWMAGGTLEQMLALGRPLAPARAVEIADSLLSALGAAHRFGILHRDVKPANVLFDNAGAALLGDFGVAHFGDLSATATAGVFGTMAYVSPEQRAGRPASARSDLFAVGVVLREMLMGGRPLDDATLSLPSEVHGGLDARHDAVIARMTASDPALRPVDADEARALLSWCDGERLAWPATPATVERSGPRAPPESRASVAPAPAVRVALRDVGAPLDTWAGRPIERLPLTECALAKARAFAAADDGGLQTVLRVDRDGDTIWLEPLPGRELDRSLSAVERAMLRSTLQALHDAGGVHGKIDPAHVVLCDPRPVLRFAVGHAPTETVEADLLALASL